MTTEKQHFNARRKREEQEKVLKTAAAQVDGMEKMLGALAKRNNGSLFVTQKEFDSVAKELKLEIKFESKGVRMRLVEYIDATDDSPAVLLRWRWGRIGWAYARMTGDGQSWEQIFGWSRLFWKLW